MHSPSLLRLASPLILRRRRLCANAATFDAFLDAQKWAMPSPAAPIHKISFSPSPPQLQNPTEFLYSNDLNPRLGPNLGENGDKDGAFRFFVVRDDLLHPLVNGNKARKLDALIPLLQKHFATDLVTCGGCQSAHAAAVAVCCAERGIRAHLLLRGEHLEVPTGYNLVSLMYGNVSYISRTEYAKREEMLLKYARQVAGGLGSVILVDDLLSKAEELEFEKNFVQESKIDGSSRKVVVVKEGAGNITALLGLVRLVRYLSQTEVFGREQKINLVVDAGTGTTAVGLALGVICYGLPWKITAVMLADTLDKYKEQEKSLSANFKRTYHSNICNLQVNGFKESPLEWVERTHPRRFGKVLEREIESCRQIACQTGVLVDPVYTLAAWEHAALLAMRRHETHSKVVMLHTGGTLGMFGLAQRYSHQFNLTENSL